MISNMLKNFISKTIKAQKMQQKEYNSYTPFVVDYKSRPLSNDVTTRYARSEDAASIARIINENNNDPSLDYNYFLKRTRSELAHGGNRSGFHIIVAQVGDQIVGYGRSIYYSELMIKNYSYPSPVGWYLMGVTIDPQYRGQNIGALLTRKRLDHINQVASKAYYVANANNKTSIRMHEKFGFKEKERGAGFLKICFNNGLGILFECNLNNKD
ncbi:GNAT family N-acetyltransferase [Halobacteriovorax vibrionivorans]|uniref:GNAT family N-acetyltransferase n=2 Tax=Halobacteriovoraceae TaxID=1652132 RepID=A0ABY0IIS0_9BACT|nr:GNAT family N-acetyltransferase [Halobacteriovorax vibrionivorans]TGD48621.1 GNAT family N-acetyltransferase [Halobacteriovorax sp. Y22]